ncbi:MarR family transcriptional regulator [Nocardia sp. NBC_01499]|uniref:GbsR/MarR family transcriptional regulator n=1 Tax=Nocardia sp. NBC_01499 TaxID=2903597 RepID=UPI003865079E
MDSMQQLRDAAEKLALILAQGGMQKATARVMTALLYTEQETMTAADLCEQLSISSGAASTALKQLIQNGLIERVPAPGSRREHFRFVTGAWATLMSQQNTMYAVMRAAAQDGLDAARAESVTADRLHEMQDFYRYMEREVLPLIDKWRQQYKVNTPK